MLLPIILALDIAAAPPAPCSPAAVEPALNAAATANQNRDFKGAERAIAAASACPVRDGPTYGAHVLRAELAVGDGDWTTARTMLSGLGVHPESTLGARAAFLQLRVDQAAGDATSFTAERDAALAANEARLLAAGGHKLEGFTVPGGTVAAYDAFINQGSFHRVYEFVATPNDPAAYPATIQLTDDQAAASLDAFLNKKGDKSAPAHVWFIDLYTCNRHTTLTPPKIITGAQPDYEEVKARVTATFADSALLAVAPPPEKTACMAGMWILPGFGQQRKPTS
jgi:hypothetical protein